MTYQIAGEQGGERVQLAFLSVDPTAAQEGKWKFYQLTNGDIKAIDENGAILLFQTASGSVESARWVRHFLLLGA